MDVALAAGLPYVGADTGKGHNIPMQSADTARLWDATWVTLVRGEILRGRVWRPCSCPSSA